MGYYLNPEDISKEQWLQEHGQQIIADYDLAEGDETVVYLIGNGLFRAVGFEEFNYPDLRQKTWWLVQRKTF